MLSLVSAGVVLIVFSNVSGQQLPDLIPLEIQAPLAITGPPNPHVRVIYTVSNQGQGIAQDAWTDNLYLSSNPWLDFSAQYLGGAAAAGPLGHGQSYSRTVEVDLPVVQSATYYLALKVNASGTLAEADIQNNRSIVPLTFVCTPPDLAPIGLIVPAATVSPPRPWVAAAWGVTNNGTGEASGGWLDILYLSTNNVLDDTAVEVLRTAHYDTLPAGGCYWRTNSVQLPASESGAYYLFIKTDAQYSVPQLVRDNDVLSVPIQLQIQKPDVTLSTLRFYPPGTLVMNVYGEVGARYQLQGSSDLIQWLGVLDFTCDRSPTVVTNNEAGNFERRFYRVAAAKGQ